jgi:NitT/TauT family transport system permease protein
MNRTLLGRIGYPLAGIALVIALWSLVCIVWKLPAAVLPTPWNVLQAIVKYRGALLSEGWVTFKATMLGFLLALALGIPIAVAVSVSRRLNLMFYPLVWLGTGMESKLAIAWLVAFFPIVVDTSAGLQSTPRELLELARSLKSSRWQVFSMVQFPAALPFVITGAKVAVTLAVIGAVIGEFVGSSDGLGFLLLSATSQINTALAFAALFALSVLGMFVYALVVLAERALGGWLPPVPVRH